MAEATGTRRERSKGIVPAEGNFEAHPYFRVGDRNAGTGILEYELRIKEGVAVEHPWMIRTAQSMQFGSRVMRFVPVQ